MWNWNRKQQVKWVCIGGYAGMFTCRFSNVKQTTFYPHILLCTPAKEHLSPFLPTFQLAREPFSLREQLRRDWLVTAAIGRRGNRLWSRQPIYLCACGLDRFMVKSSTTNKAWICMHDWREPKTTQQKSPQGTVYLHLTVTPSKQRQSLH